MASSDRGHLDDLNSRQARTGGRTTGRSACLLPLAPNFFCERRTAGIRSPQSWSDIRIAGSQEEWQISLGAWWIISPDLLRSGEFITALRASFRFRLGLFRTRSKRRSP